MMRTSLSPSHLWNLVFVVSRPRIDVIFSRPPLIFTLRNSVIRGILHVWAAQFFPLGMVGGIFKLVAPDPADEPTSLLAWAGKRCNHNHGFLEPRPLPTAWVTVKKGGFVFSSTDAVFCAAGAKKPPRIRIMTYPWPLIARDRISARTPQTRCGFATSSTFGPARAGCMLVEMVHGVSFATRGDMRRAVSEYI